MRHLRDEEERLRLACGCGWQHSSDTIPIAVQYLVTFVLRTHRTEHASEAPACRGLHKGGRKRSRSLAQLSSTEASRRLEPAPQAAMERMRRME